jgi:hypothetical protein
MSVSTSLAILSGSTAPFSAGSLPSRGRRGRSPPRTRGVRLARPLSKPGYPPAILGYGGREEVGQGDVRRLARMLSIHVDVVLIDLQGEVRRTTLLGRTVNKDNNGSRQRPLDRPRRHWTSTQPSNTALVRSNPRAPPPPSTAPPTRTPVVAPRIARRFALRQAATGRPPWALAGRLGPSPRPGGDL